MMEKKVWKNVIMVMGLILVLCAVFSPLAGADEAALKLVASSKNIVIEMSNDAPVRGLQFTVNGVKITETRTTPRTAGFLIKFNEKNGKVILLSTSGDKIAPGKGAIAEIICDKPGSASLSEVKIVKEKNKG